MAEPIGRQLLQSNPIVGAGEMADRVTSFDWSQTPLGPIHGWPRSLVTAVNICLNSRFPMVMWWGRDLTMIYNDAWRPVLGASKHPHALGSPGRRIWPEIWDTIGLQLNSVLDTGKATWSDDLLLVLDRNFYTEEAYFTYSYSPVLLEDNIIGGVFSAVSETTQRVIGERRLQTLGALGLNAAETKTTEEAYRRSCNALVGNPFDVPFALLYAVAPDGKSARLIDSVRFERGKRASPEQIWFEEDSSSGWPLATVAQTGVLEHVTDLVNRMGELPGGAWPTAPVEAVVIPMADPGQNQLAGLAVVGISSHRRFDSDYRSFLTLAVGHIATAVANARAYEQERKRAEALAEMDRVKTTFFSNVSHEFRTPLTLMLGPLEEVLADPETSPSNRERAMVAHRNSLRLLKLVNTLLDFSRIEAGRIQARYELVDLAAFTVEIASNFRSATEQAGLDLIVDCRPLPGPVYIDREMWEKIVLNLISNAFKFTLEGSIRIELAAAGASAELRVKDTGAGIPAAELPRLFDRFHRVEGAKGRTHEGSGIGLALVQELVKAHGGTVSAESVVERGSVFTVRIPFGKNHLPGELILRAPSESSTAVRAEAYVQEALRWLPPDSGERDELPAPSDIAPTPGEEKSRVLLAEDNADMRDYVSRMLSPHMEVTAVTNGQEALTSALENPPDLILSDVMMPVLDGFGLLEQLRSDAKTNTLPVILLSARAGEESRVEGVGAGADDYLVKPFSARELLARVRGHLKMARVRRDALDAVRRNEAELRRLNEDLNQFAYSASHDLQEPLRNISIYSQLLQRKLGPSADEEVREFLEFLEEGSSRMETLLRDLLAYTQITAVRSASTWTDANLALRNTLETLKLVIADSGAEIRSPDLPALPVGEIHLHQLFQNLIGNGLKYRTPGRPPLIQLGVTRQGGWWQFSIQDNGIGIAPEYHKRVFGIFKRLHSADQYSGTGIGLAIAQRIVERYNGQIWVESELGHGATFFFTLPAL